MNPKPVIFWDWNGTLLDDVDCCVLAMNKLLEARNLKQLDRNRYREVFDFPVKNYYEKLGFDFRREAFELPAHQFMKHYNELVGQATVFEDAARLLGSLQQKGFRQFILSAMEQALLEDLTQKNGIQQYFEGIHGIDNHLADGKLETAKKLFATIDTSAENCLLIGDSLHDAEVAEKLNIQVLLFSQGHFSQSRLLRSNKAVAHDYQAIEVFIEKYFGF
ncbi:MAG: HAD hydrolase-like protein [Bacteroidales bacterium]|nr:HAD hydrolase-like protein [Bacteroidales bacterium]